MTTPLRLALFIDGQNAYRRARALFFPNAQSGRDGQFSPMDLGRLIAGRGGPNGVPCTLLDVWIYSGGPDARRDPRTCAAHRRQTQRWSSVFPFGVSRSTGNEREQDPNHEEPAEIFGTVASAST